MSRRLKLALVAGLSAFLVLVGSTAGFAFWTAGTTVTTTVGAAVLNLTETNLTGASWGNDSIASAAGTSMVSTGSFTATNSTVTTSAQSGSVTLTLSAGSTPGALAAKVTRVYWTTTDPASCTASVVAPPAAAATSAAWTTSASFTFSLAKNASQSYCVRSTIAKREDVAVSGGTMSFQPQVAGTMTVGNFIDTEIATATQSTQYIYPTPTTVDTTHFTWIRPNFGNASWNYCLDVSYAATTSGTIVISYGCKTQGASNQQWKLTDSGATGGYFTIQPRSTSALRVDDNSTTASGGSISVNTAGSAATAKNQQWQLQQVTTGVYEFVSAYSGMCMTSPSGTDRNLGNLTQMPCNGSVYQQFKLSQAFENFTCSTTTSNYSFSWTSASTGPYHVRIQGQSTDLATTAATAAVVTIPTSAVAKNVDYDLYFIDDNGTIVGTGNIGHTNGDKAKNFTCDKSDLQ